MFGSVYPSMALPLNMEAGLSSSSPTAVTTTSVSAASPNTIPTFVAKILTNSNSRRTPLTLSFTTKTTPRSRIFPISRISSSSSRTASSNSTSSTATVGINGAGCDNRHWMVLVEAPPQELTAKSLIIDYYVSKLERVLGSQKDAQRCIYDVSCHTHFGFCCDINEERARELASVPGVVSVKPDHDIDSTKKDYSCLEIKSNTHFSPFHGSTLLFPAGTTKHWLVRMERPAIGVIRRAQVVDYYVQVLMRVLRSEQDAQMCIYHISWQSNYGFCCELDDECAQELTAVPGVLSVQPDENVESDDKDYAGDNSRTSEGSSASSLTRNIRTKKLFVTGLSFYTSEKTLSAAFEGFGELVEVKIIMDKISKRSKGYAFVEYTTEEAASTALREMNGKIINGWMITVDVAKTNPPKYSRGQPRPTS